MSISYWFDFLINWLHRGFTVVADMKYDADDIFLFIFYFIVSSNVSK